MNKIIEKLNDSIFVTICCIFVPIVSACLTLVALDMIYLTPFIEGLRRWQTLIGGILTLVAAFITVYYLHKQIKQSEEQQKQIRRQELLAAKITAIGVLLDISNYCDRLIRYYLEVVISLSNNEPAAPFPNEHHLPHLNDALFLPLVNIVKYDNNKHNIQLIYEFFKSIQHAKQIDEYSPEPYNCHYSNIITIIHNTVALNNTVHNISVYFMAENGDFISDDNSIDITRTTKEKITRKLAINLSIDNCNITSKLPQDFLKKLEKHFNLKGDDFYSL